MKKIPQSCAWLLIMFLFISVAMSTNAQDLVNNRPDTALFTQDVNITDKPTTMTVTISGNSACPGGNVSFSATPFGNNGSVTYLWKKNGATVTGLAGPPPNVLVLLSGNFNNGDVIACVANSSTGQTATSNSLTITILSTTPSFTVSAGPTTGISYCQGNYITFSANASGPVSQYQWLQGGTPISGATSSTYTTTVNSLSQLQNISVVATSAPSGCSSGGVTATGSVSNIPFIVNPSVTPSISIATGTSSVCSGRPVTFTATSTNGGSFPSYQWIINGSNVSGATTNSFTTSSLTNNQAVACIMTTSAACASSPSVISNIFNMTVNNSHTMTVTVVGNNPICGSGAAAVSAGVSNWSGNLSYNWQLNGSDVTSDAQGGPPYTYTKNNPANGSVITCTVSSDAACYNTAVSNNYTVAITTPSAFSIGVGPTTGLTYCVGSSISFTASSNQAISQYQWTLGGSPIPGATGATYTTTVISVAQLQSIGVNATASGGQCIAVPNTASASAWGIPFVVNPVVTPGILIATGAANTACIGTASQFTSSITNGGTSPQYQWLSNGNPIAGATGASFTFNPGSAGTYAISCTLSSNAECTTTTSATSPVFALTLNPSVGTPAAPSGPATFIKTSQNVTYTTSASNATGYTWTITPSNAATLSQGYPDPLSATTFWTEAFSGQATISVSANGCNGPSAVVSKTITVYPYLNAPLVLPWSQKAYSVNTIQPLTSSAVTGGDGNYTYQWEDSTQGGQWTVIPSANTSSLAHPANPFNTYYRLLVIDMADTVYSNTVFVGLYFNGGIIKADTALVTAGSGANLLNVVSASGDNCQGAYTYFWQSSPDEIIWTGITGPAINGVFQPTFFRRLAVCGNDTVLSNTVIIKPQSPGGTIIPVTGTPSGNRPLITLPAYQGVDDPENMNYIRTRSFSKPGITDTITTGGLTAVSDVHQSTTYFDGLGRPLQTVDKQATPGQHDLITPQLYDPFGRESQKFLAYTDNAASGHFRTDAGIRQTAFYDQLYNHQEKYYYSNITWDGSPQNQLIKNSAPGNSWTGNNIGIHTIARTNALYDSVVSWNTGYTTDTLPVFGGYYDPGVLFVKETTDEQGNKNIEYKDKYDQLILKKVQQANAQPAGHKGWLCTYYIYNDLNELSGVLPPQAVQLLQAGNWIFESPLLSGSVIAQELCFWYQYDTRKRMTVKKIPGAGKVYMVYDARDRLVMIQDSLLRKQGMWTYNQYDSLNRQLLSGLWTTPGNISYHQSIANSMINYPNPVTGNEVLTQNFYDDYNWVSQSGSGLPATPDYTQTTRASYFSIPSNSIYPYPQPITAMASTIGQITGTKVEVLGTTTYLYSVRFYDDHSRMVQQINTNISGGKDTITMQYSFDGRLLSSLQQHQYKNTNNTYQDYQLITKMQYDPMGRLLKITKGLNGGTDAVIMINSYNELGQLRRKDLGNDPNNSGNPLDSLIYTYNIRGWLDGINKKYTNDGASYSQQNWFGMELNYDYGFNQVQYNGNIAGIKWRSRGTDVTNAYGFNYDNLNRLLRADFTQQRQPGTWDISGGINFSTRSLQYDLNGNIRSMTQFGVKLNQSVIIDSLAYGYMLNSNKLQYVTDQANDTISRLGDFKEKVNDNSTDYAYDGNGNLILDNNKGISAINYNVLNLPQSILITNKGTITYVYDAAGNKLKKIITDNTVIPAKITTTNYAGTFNYQNDTLQFITHEEGRLRPDSPGHPQYPFSGDFFIKDHLGNVRMVLTDQQQTDLYPAASMETNHAGVDTMYYSNINNTRTSVPAGYPTDTSYANPNQYVAELDGNGNKIGPGIVLKVMSGDKINIRVSAWYKAQVQAPAPAVSPVMDLVVALTSSIPLVSAGKVTGAALGAPVLQPSITNFLVQRDSSGIAIQPKAYLNWLLFDEQFKYVSAGSGFQQVDTSNVTHPIIKADLPVPLNGYLYIYTSNETPNIQVFFDNLAVTHVRGPLVEENHYYPFGLTMAGISSKALKPGYTENKFKFNNKELQSKEFSDGNGLDAYDFGTRMQDPQIGRWCVLDPKADLLEMSSPYAYCYNDPIIYKDPDGELAILINGRVGGDEERPVNGHQGIRSYWDQGIIDAIKSSGIPDCGTDSKLFFVDGDQFFGSTVIPFEPLTFEVRDGGFFAGNDPDARAGAGSLVAYQDWNTIKSKLAKDPKTGKIIEKIEIYTHSRGAAFGAGYIETLLKLISTNADEFADPDNEIDLVYNMGDHQSWGITEPGNLNAYSHDHCKDPLSGNKMNGIKAAFTSNETSPGALGAHSTSSFVKDIKAFTKAFATSKGHSRELLIQKFVDSMQLDYGITVEVKNK